MPGSKSKKPVSKSEVIDATGGQSVSKIDAAAAELEGQLGKEQNDRLEERFYWIAAVVVLIDFIAAPDLGAAFIAIFLLEIVILIGLANKLGVDPVVILLRRIFDKFLTKDENSD